MENVSVWKILDRPSVINVPLVIIVILNVNHATVIRLDQLEFHVRKMVFVIVSQALRVKSATSVKKIFIIIRFAKDATATWPELCPTLPAVVFEENRVKKLVSFVPAKNV